MHLAQETNYSEQAQSFWREEEEGKESLRETQRERKRESVLESEPNATYSPPSSSSSCHRSIPVRPLISHEPLCEFSQVGPLSTELLFIYIFMRVHTSARTPTVHKCSQLGCTPARTYLLSSVSYITLVFTVMEDRWAACWEKTHRQRA